MLSEKKDLSRLQIRGSAFSDGIHTGETRKTSTNPVVHTAETLSDLALGDAAQALTHFALGFD